MEPIKIYNNINLTLLDETRRAIEETGHTPDQIQYIGDGSVSCDWDTFVKISNEKYDTYEAPVILSGLMIYFTDGGVLIRFDNGDNYEGWRYVPPMPNKKGRVMENYDLFDTERLKLL